jgi:hypothetical protein
MAHMAHNRSQRRCVAIAARRCMLTALLIASTFVARGAQAQTAACDQLKGDLAARIDASGARGYALDAVPSGMPVPPGAKAIGTCEAGKYKILYRRWGGATPSAAGLPGAPKPASVLPAAELPDGQTRRPPIAPGGRAGRPASASAPGSGPQPVSRSDEPAPVVQAPGRDPKETPGGAAGDAGIARASEADSAVAQTALVKPDANVVAKVSLARRAGHFLTEHWHWFLALVLLPLAGWSWAWLAHRRAYDAAGLPRGPKL